MNDLPSVLIAEDEPLARQKLVRLVSEVKWLGEVFEAVDGEAAKSAIDHLKPHVIFMDIKMPKLSGLEALNQSKHQAKVIFTTALDQYGVLAFELGAIDYLLKPFSNERFKIAITKLKDQIHTPTLNIDYLTDFQKKLWGNLPHFFVRIGKRVKKINTESVEWIEGDGEYLRLHTGTHYHLIKMRLYEIELALGQRNFIKVHRSRIINLSQISELKTISNGKFEIIFNSGKTTKSSREGAQVLRTLVL